MHTSGRQVYILTTIRIFISCNTASFYRPAPKNEDEMMVAIFECIDRMFSIVRPRRLLYMAIDGVVRISNTFVRLSATLINNPLVFFFMKRHHVQR